LARIIAHVAVADFSRRLVRVDKRLAGLVYQGTTITVQTRLPSVEAHLLKRIYIEQQWLPSTTVDQYLADAHTSAQHADVEVWTYRWQGHATAGFLSPWHGVTAPKSERCIFVAYVANYGRIVTCFQASSAGAIPALAGKATNLVKQR